MEGCPKTLMISFDTKEPATADFTQPIQNYIRDHYQENPESYKHEIQQINQLKKSISGVTRDNQGCSTLRRYFAQLHFLQSRFPMREGDKAAVPFTWYDVYMGDPLTRKDIRYEQACVLFNLAGLYSQLGANESRLTDESMKVACTYFQCSAGTYQYLKENYLLDSLPDMIGDILQLKAVIMLGQAQECLLEKSVRDNRKNTLIARICMQIIDYFQEAITLLQGDSTSEMGSSLRKSWMKHLQIKVLTCYAISYIYMSNEADEEKKFGEKVGYLKGASSKMNEAMKMSKNQPEQVMETLKFLCDVVGNKLEAAVKENDFVYHSAVPEIDKLPEIHAVCLVKAMSFQFDDPSISGPDIFQKLIPMRAHEASSLYSEEKAGLLREIGKEIESKDLQLSDSLSSMHIDDLMNPVDESMPESLLEKRKSLTEQGDVVNSTADHIRELAKLSEEFELILNEISAKLNSEEKFEREAMIGDSESGLSSELENLKKEFSQCSEVNEKARTTNASLCDHFEESKEIIELLAGPEDRILASLPSQNVIDAPTDEPVVQRIRELLAAIDKMKSQRKILEKQLRDQLNKDDITNLLVINEDGNKEAFFKEQLKKHDEMKVVIRQNLNAQDGILLSLTESNAKYAPTRIAAGEISAQRDAQIQSYLAHAKLFEEVRERLGRGLSFYKSLRDTLIKLRKKVNDFSQKREKEKAKFVELKKKEVPPSRPSAPKPTFNRASKPTGMQAGPLNPGVIPNPPTLHANIPGTIPRPQMMEESRQPMLPFPPAGGMHSAQGLRLPPVSQTPRPVGPDGMIMQPRMPSSYPLDGMQPRFIPTTQMQPRLPQSSQTEDMRMPAANLPGVMSRQPHPPNPVIRPVGQEQNMQWPANRIPPAAQPPQAQQFPTEMNPLPTGQPQVLRMQDPSRDPRGMNPVDSNRPVLVNTNQQRFGMKPAIRPSLQDPFRPPSQDQFRPQNRPPVPNFQPGQIPRQPNPSQSQPQMQFRPPHDVYHTRDQPRLPFMSSASVTGVSVPSLNPTVEHTRFSSYQNVPVQMDPNIRPLGQNVAFRPMQNQGQLPRQPVIQSNQPGAVLPRQYAPGIIRNIPPGENMPGLQRHSIQEQMQPADGYGRWDQGTTLIRQDSTSRQEMMQPRGIPDQSSSMRSPGPGQLQQFSNPDQYRYPTLPEPLQPTRRLPEPLLPARVGQDMPDVRQPPPVTQEFIQPGQIQRIPSEVAESMSPTPSVNSSVIYSQNQDVYMQNPPSGYPVAPRRDDDQDRNMNAGMQNLQLMQPLQPSQLMGNTQKSMIERNEGDLQRARENSSSGRMLDLQPEVPQMPTRLQTSNCAPPDIAKQDGVLRYASLQNDIVQSNQYAFQGPISSPRPESGTIMPADYSSTPAGDFQKQYETPSAPPQSIGMQTPGMRNLPPYSPTQVFDPVTMNNRPVMAATRSGDSLISGILGNSASVQGQKNNQPDAMQVGMQQFQIQQLLLQQQQLISMIQNQQNQQKVTESLQIEKLQHQLVDQQRYIDKLASEQHKLQHERELSSGEQNSFVAAQLQLKIHEQNEQLRQQQKELQQLHFMNMKAPQKRIDGASQDPSVIKSSSSGLENAKSTISSTDLLSSLDLSSASTSSTSTDKTIDSSESKSKSADLGFSTDQAQLSIVESLECLDNVKLSGESEKEAKAQLRVDLDQFELEMDAVLSGAVENTLTTPTCKESHLPRHSEIKSVEASFTKVDFESSPVRNDKHGVEEVFAAAPVEPGFPFYEPMLDKEQTERSRQISNSSSSRSSDDRNSHEALEDSHASLDESNCDSTHNTESLPHACSSENDKDAPVESSTVPDSTSLLALEKNKESASPEPPLESSLAEVKHDEIAANAVEPPSNDMKTSIKSPFNSDLIPEVLKLPDYPVIVSVVESDDKDEPSKLSSENIKATSTVGCTVAPDTIGRMTSPVSIPVASDTLSPNADASPPRPYLNRQQGRLSFLQAQDEVVGLKAYLEDLDSAVEHLHEQCMDLCKKQQGKIIDGFTQMWDDLAQVEELDSCSFTTNAGKQNANKNRYRDILPYDHSRVLLKSLPNDYINANHVDKLTPLSPAYIASQGPIPQCFADFWSMVWEQKCTVIVMLTNEVEGTKLKCHPYWPRKLEQTMEYGDIAVYLMEQEAGPSWKSRKFFVSNLKVNDSRVVTQLQFTAWPDYGIPSTPYDLLSFNDEVRRCYESTDVMAENPLLLHCSAGVGRTGTFSCIYSAIEEINGGNGLVEVPGLIRKLRQCRFHMVQRKEQLIFCYQAILCYAQQFLAEEQMKQDSKNSRSPSLLDDEVMLQLNQVEKEASAEKIDPHKEYLHSETAKEDSVTEKENKQLKQQSSGPKTDQETEDNRVVPVLGSTELLSGFEDSGTTLRNSAAAMGTANPSGALVQDEIGLNDEEARRGRDRADSIPKFKVKSDIFSTRSPPPSPGNHIDNVSEQT